MPIVGKHRQNTNKFKEDYIVKQFNFYKSYMDNISNLTHTEAGQYIKKLLDFMFRDKDLDELATDKVTSLLLLISDDLRAEKERESSGNHTPNGRERRFAFRSIYANIFFYLKDVEAGILIKQICDFMFGSEIITPEDCKCVKSYFSAIKVPLAKSKVQSERAQKQKKVEIITHITLDKIRADFPFITGNLRWDNPILDDVDLNSLYAFIKEKQAVLQGQSMYSVVMKYREHIHAETIPM